eukprot:13905747-Alexandrium_andersonii.AAC.1
MGAEQRRNVHRRLGRLRDHARRLMSAPNAEMSQGHLLALARYARLTNDQTQRHLMALDAYWTAATDTGGTASAPP